MIHKKKQKKLSNSNVLDNNSYLYIFVIKKIK